MTRLTTSGIGRWKQARTGAAAKADASASGRGDQPPIEESVTVDAERDLPFSTGRHDLKRIAGCASAHLAFRCCHVVQQASGRRLKPEELLDLQSSIER